MIYLSEKQSSVVKAKLPSLKDIILPAWAPQRLIANDLGFSPQGMQKALASLDGTPYLWATELENVHDIWVYDEPHLTRYQTVLRVTLFQGVVERRTLKSYSCFLA